MPPDQSTPSIPTVDVDASANLVGVAALAAHGQADGEVGEELTSDVVIEHGLILVEIAITSCGAVFLLTHPA